MNFNEAITLRQNILCQTLAGATAIDPLYSLPIIAKLQDNALTDIQARRFIEAVKARQSDLENATPEQQSKIVVRIAGENHLLADYMRWITLPSNIYGDVTVSVKELQALTITRKTIAGLQDWIKTCEELNEWRPTKKS